MLSPRRRSWLNARTPLALIALLTLLGLLGGSAGSASAAVSCPELSPTPGLPAITLTKEMPADQLYATPIPVTLRAAQPVAPPPESGFNLSFRDVLPAGVSYVNGSSSPAPQVIADQPAIGMTTLIWSNVADLAPGSDYELSYEVSYDTSLFDAGDSIETGTTIPAAAAGAYVNCNPRWIPLFNGAGQPIGTPSNSASSSAIAPPQQTLLKAIEIEKSEPSPESELLRGVHNNQTPYTLTVRNNTQRPTDDLVIVDYLPAGLEFLGCGTVDNTTNVAYNGGSSVEYPGSGPINPGHAPGMPDCVVPDSVQFGNWDPDGAGPASSGLYTRVEWNLGSTLAALEEFELQYAAAIPICPNTTTWTAGAPTGASLGQTANLDNNNCAGGETTDETALTNYATASGDYHQLDNDIVPVSDTDGHTVSAEDLAIEKTADDGDYEVGETVRWNLEIRTSEYRSFTNVVITDTVPDGMCPVLGTEPPSSPSADPECAATGVGTDNPSLPWSSTTENPDGSWTVTWNLPPTPADDTSTVSFSTLARIYYQENGADANRVLATDPLTNEVRIAGNGWPICTDGSDVVPCSDPGAVYVEHTQPPGTLIEDESESTVNSGLPELDKLVATPVSVGSPAVCPAGGDPGYINGPASFYRVGDIICWKLRVDFPGTVSTGGVTLTDFLPAGAEFVPGVPGTGPTGNNDVGIATVTDHGSFVDFVLTAPDVDETGRVFEYVIATRMLNTVDDPGVELPPIRGNLLKMTSVNTAGDVTTYRDQADAEIEQPELTVTKGVKSINGNPVGGNGPNVDGGSVVGGQPVVYRVDVSNPSLVDVVDTTVVERMVGPYDCTMVSAISAGGTCATVGSGPTALTEITWTGVMGVDVDAGDSVELNFTMTYPNAIAPGVQINDVACVKDFQNETNDFLNPRYTWVVPNPVATCGTQSSVPPTMGQLIEDEINDPSHVTAPGSIAKAVTTSVNETNNSAGGQATIGETINYSVTATIPDGTTVNNFLISDAIVAPTRQLYVAGSAACSSTAVGFCGASTVAYSSGTVSLAHPTSYTNSSGSAQTITLSFDVTVADIGANSAGSTLTNTGTVSYEDQYGVTQAPQTNQTSITVVEPNPRIAKNEDDGDDSVSADQEIEYMLTVTNPSRTGPTRPSSPSHNTVVTDVVPVGLTPSNGSGAAIADGGTVVRCDGSPGGGTGTWSQGTRTITWSLGTVAPASTTTLRYCADVDSSPPPVAGTTLSNTATVNGTSMPGVVTGERSYSHQAIDTVTVAGSTLTKSASPTNVPVGGKSQYTVTVTLPALTAFYLYEVRDTLPAGLALVSFDGFVCSGNCGGVPTPTTGQSGQNLTWDFGDIPSDGATRTLTLTYTAVVRDVVGNQQGTLLTNSASNRWCTVDVPSPCPGGSLITPPAATANISVTEPNLSIDKDVAGQTGDTDQLDVEPGDDPFTYTVTVSNSGNSTAYDAIVQDQVPSTLTNVVLTPQAGVTVVAATPPNNQAWRIDSIPAGGSVTITYTADLIASSGLTDPFTAVNTASITQYWGLDDADRASNPDAREYPEGADPTDTVTLNGQLPRPQVVKTVANSGNAEIGQPLRWTLTISNLSTVAALNDIDVSDTLPTGWNYVTGSTLRNSLPYSDPTGAPGPALAWINVGDIPGGGANIVLSFEATPTMAALDVGGNPTNPYVNQASIGGVDGSGASGGQAGPYTDTDSENANIQMPVLSIAKTPNSATVHAGDWNNWTIVITNSGLGTARNVEIRDAVPAGLFYNLVTHPTSATCALPPLNPPCDNFTRTSVANSGTGPNDITWSLDSLAPGQSITITLPMYVDADVISGTTYVNNAYVKSTERPTEISDPGQWTTDRSADMAIVKSDGGVSVNAGDNVTYTLTATNNGPSSANNAQVADLIDTGVFEFVSITRGDPDDVCSTTGAPVVTGITCDVNGVLSPGDSRVFTLVLKVKSGVTGSVSNTATVSADEPDPVGTNDSSTDTTPIGVQTALTIDKVVKTGSPSSILNQDETVFTVTVSNAGPSDAVNVPVRDTLPAGLSCTAVTIYTPTGCSGNPGDVVTLTIPLVPAGESRSFDVTVRGEVVGLQTNTAAVDVNGGDSDTADVTVSPMADLLIYKDGPESVQSGADFDFDLTVQNQGPDSAVTPHIEDTLPEGLIYLGYTAPPGTTCSISGRLFTCDLPTMASGDEIIVNMHVNSGYTFSEGSIENSATVSSTTPDSNPSDNEGSDSVMVGPNADVAIVKSGPAFGAEGWPLTYVLSVVNNGPATAELVTVTDQLPAGVSFQSASSTVGTCAENSGEVTCDLGDMAIGEAAQITIVVVPGAGVVGTTIVNNASVSSDTIDGVPSNNSSQASTPIENNSYPTSSNMTVTKTSSNPTPKVGDLVSFTIVATNQGPSTAQAATLVDTLPSGLIYSSWSGDGQCAYVSPTLSCQLGDVPSGQSRTIVVSAYVAQTGSVVNSVLVGAANDRLADDNAAVSPVTVSASSARLSITKKASKKTVRVGGKVKFTIRVKNVSRVNAVNVEVCDLIPARLSVVYRAGGTLRSGNLCWTIPVLRAGASRTFKPTFRVSNGRGASVTNPVRARAGNARTVRAKAKIRVPARAARAGGTTG